MRAPRYQFLLALVLVAMALPAVVCAQTGWWDPDYSYRQQLTIANPGADAGTDYTIALQLDTSNTGGKMRPDGADLRVVYWTGSAWKELDRVVTSPGTTYTTVLFRLQKPLASGQKTTDYWLYYGNPWAAPQATNYRNVYYYVADFEEGAGGWISPNNATIEEVTEPDGNRVISVTGPAGANHPVAYDPTMTPAKNIVATVRMKLIEGADKEGALGFRMEPDTGNGLILAIDSWGSIMIFGNYIGTFAPNQVEGSTQKAFSSSTGKWHYLMVRAVGQKLQGKAWKEDEPEPAGWDVEATAPPDMFPDPGVVGIGMYADDTKWYVDDFRVRLVNEVEPTVDVGAEEAFTGTPGTRLSGKVLEDGTQIPIANALVTIKAPGATYTATTDSSGVFRKTVPAGTYDVTVTAADYTPKTLTGVAVPAAGADIEVALVFTKGRVAGRVTDKTGAPVAGAAVAVEPGGYTAKTDTDGRYSVAVPAGKYSVAVAADNYWRVPATTDVSVTVPRTTTVDFALTAIPSKPGWPKDVGGDVFGGITLFDLDNDGKLEVIAGVKADQNPNTTPGKVFVWKADGTLLPGWPVETLGAVYGGASVGDIDGDGQPEIVAGDYHQEGDIQYGGRVYAWNVDGSVVPGFKGGVLVSGTIFFPPALIDIDNDGKMEIVALTYSGGEQIHVLKGDGSTAWVVSAGGNAYSSPAIADVDGNGTLDIIVLTAGYLGALAAKDGSEIWSATAENETGAGGTNWSSPAVGDLDGDGKPEITFSYSYGTKAFSNTGEIKWRTPEADDITSPALGDINKDGFTDVVVCVQGKLMALNGPDGRILWSTQFTDAGSRNSPVLADVNGDGRLEAIALGSNDVVGIIASDGSIAATLRATPAGGGNRAAPAVGDVDGDGRLEVFIGNSATNSVFAWTLGPNPTDPSLFTWPQFHRDAAHRGNLALPIPMPPPPAPAVVRGDLTGDGKVGIPDATLALRIAVGLAQATAEQLAAGDLNGNGKIDIPDVTKILRAAVGLEVLK